MFRAGFLDAIHSEPRDRSARLVYADWLDERGDPRAELIRIEEEMRQIPVFSDQFWLLKPRRNELRAQTAPEWLRVMGYGTSCYPVFAHGWPGGWRERWRLIRELVSQWRGDYLSDVGSQNESVTIAERLGRHLPPSVSEWIDFRQEVPVELYADRDQYSEIADRSTLSLLVGRTEEYVQGVRYADFSRDDPPVYGYRLEGGNLSSGTFILDDHGPGYPTLTEFAILLVLGQEELCPTGGKGFSFIPPDELRAAVEANCQVNIRIGNMILFEADDVLASLQTYGGHAYLIVSTSRFLPLESFPAWLRPYAQAGQGGRTQIDLPPGPDDIPF